MNNRDYKEFAPGSYYHVFNRGNGKQNIFLDNGDYEFFLLRLRENLFPKFSIPLKTAIKGIEGRNKSHTSYVRKLLPEDSFDLVSYCLMPNHYHFLIKQNSDISIAKLISKICTSYSKIFNKKNENVGHVFQDKFRAVLVDSNEYLVWLSAYIHNNPKTAGLVKSLLDYPWSSYHDYMGNRQDSLCKKDIILSQFKKISDYKKFVDEASELILEKKELENMLLDND